MFVQHESPMRSSSQKVVKAKRKTMHEEEGMLVLTLLLLLQRGGPHCPFEIGITFQAEANPSVTCDTPPHVGISNL